MQWNTLPSIGVNNMPCRKEHAIVSTFVGALFVALTSHDKCGIDFWKSIGYGALGGAIGGMLPDYLDQPTSPWHRSHAHGLVPLCSAPVVMLTTTNPFIQGFGAGYTTHLLQDSFTSMGLPL